MRTDTLTGMTAEVAEGPSAASVAAAVPGAALYRLLAWLSPSFPVGAFAYSSGLEWAVEAGDIRDADSLCRWLRVLVRDGGLFCDAALFGHAHRATMQGDAAALAETAELALALAPSAERFLETTTQGKAFVAAVQSAWPCAALAHLPLAPDGTIAYPIAVAVVTAGHGIALAPALHAFAHALVANLISAGVRLVPLGQTDGQRVLAALEPAVAAACARAETVPLDAVGSAAFRADLAAMRHETQYTRLFRS
ncbi:urease accessory protein UreF [Rhodoplanes roseus]|uniref:Urease accessory protein UreF n=1 Tax=Rhodoplanes roseus TaxID=29409 RepID=A0A327L0Z1_9BRAD|nr:urease accessory UreF family protein [Rhodoplanes roseus]RAI43615.1 urease accessory protein UreF [Rhodoplanes roseus]